VLAVDTNVLVPVLIDDPGALGQRRGVFLSAMQTYITGSADFADCVILAEGGLAGYESVTFDRKLGKLAGARLLAS
jgi:predicted nucleic-acid-binding protein